MKRVALALLMTFLVFGMLLHSPLVIAKEGSDSNTSGSSNTESSVSKESTSVDSDVEDDDNGTSIEDDDNETEKETASERIKREREETKERREKLIEARKIEKEFRQEIKDANGSKIVVEKKLELDEEGNLRVEITKRLILVNGTVIIKKIKIQRDSEGIEREIKTESGDSVIVSEDLEIDDDFEDNETDLGVTDSRGSRHKIKILPDEASEIARERLKAGNFTIEIKEVIDGRNVPRVVYNIQSDKPGRFLGVFKLALKTETEIDPETGGTIVVNKPWWAFLVSEENDDTTTETEGTTDNGSASGTVPEGTEGNWTDAPEVAVDCFDSEKGTFVNCDELNETETNSTNSTNSSA